MQPQSPQYEDPKEWVSAVEPGWRHLTNIKSVSWDSFVNKDDTGRRIHIEYFLRESDNTLMAKVVFGPGAQGPPGHTHGGAITAVLDEAMGSAAWMAGHTVVAVELTVRFKKLLPLGAPCIVETRVLDVDGRRVRMGSSLRGRSGDLHAEGEGLFITLRAERFGDVATKAKGFLDRDRKQ